MKIGIDIGGSHIGIGIINQNNEIVSKKEYNWEKEEKEDLLETVKIYSSKAIKEIMIENSIDAIESIGIGFPSDNIVDGVITVNSKSLNLKEILSNEFNVPVCIKNDVKCSGTCEKNIGSLKKYNNCLFITLGTGIGGAYFYKNQLVSGSKYQGFEVGHMVINTEGRKCKCGRKGCFEKYASMGVFRKEIEELLDIKKLTSFKMFEILEDEEKLEEVNEIIEKYEEYLSIGISNLISIFEPEAISIGGSFTYYAPIFMEGLKNKIKKIFNGRDIPDILTAKYENDAGIIGATMIK